MRLRALCILALAGGCAARPLPLPDIDDGAPTELHDLSTGVRKDAAVPDLGAEPDLSIADLAAPPDLAPDAAPVDLAPPAVDFGEICGSDGGTLLWARQLTGPLNIASNLNIAGSQLLVTGDFTGGFIDLAGTQLTDPNLQPHWGVFDADFALADGAPSHAHYSDDDWVIPDGQEGRIVLAALYDGDGGARQQHLWHEDSTGRQLWNRNWGAAGLNYAQIAVDAQGNLFLTGHLYTAIDFGTGLLPAKLGSAGSYLLARLDSTGQLVWARTFDLSAPWTNSGVTFSLALDGSDALLISGELTAPQGIGGAPLPAQSFTAASFAAKYDADGNFQWMKTPDYYNHCLIATDASDEVALSCVATALVVDKLDAQGATLWERSFTGRVRANGLALDGHGNLLWSGTLLSTVDFGQGALLAGAVGFTGEAVVKLAGSDGATIWSRYLVHVRDAATGGFFSDLPHALAVDATDAVYVTGWYNGALDLCGPILPAPPTDDNTFVVKLAP